MKKFKKTAARSNGFGVSSLTRYLKKVYGQFDYATVNHRPVINNALDD